MRCRIQPADPANSWSSPQTRKSVACAATAQCAARSFSCTTFRNAALNGWRGVEHALQDPASRSSELLVQSPDAEIRRVRSDGAVRGEIVLLHDIQERRAE